LTGVYAGSVHTCMLTSTGEVYACGKFEYAGHGGRHDVLVPSVVEGLDGKTVVQVSGELLLFNTYLGDIHEVLVARA
jgi:alpha-tubulin suppressor-like RCC1 family protein